MWSPDLLQCQKHVIVLLSLLRLGVRRPIIFAAVLVTLRSLVWFLMGGEGRVKKQVGQNNIINWLMLWCSSRSRRGAAGIPFSLRLTDSIWWLSE